jgi:type I restriction enzyme S subunit
VNGKLPVGWVWTTIGETTKPLQKRVNPQDYPDLPYIGMENVEAHTMKLLGIVPAKEMKSTADSFTAGDVLYGRLRPYLNKVYSPDFNGLCSTEFIIFRKVPHINSRFIQFFLNSWEFVTFANSLNAGDRPRVKFEQFADYPFPLPPLTEQERIVRRIESLFTRLDAGVAGLKRAQAALKRYRASVLKAACEGRLVPQDPNDEPAEELLKRILAEKGESMKITLPNRDLPDLPKGWVWTKIETLASGQKYSLAIGPFGSNLKVSDYRDKGVPLIFVRNIRTGHFDGENTHYISEAKATELKAHQVYEGDILITKMGEPPGDACIYQQSQQMAVITADCIGSITSLV